MPWHYCEIETVVVDGPPAHVKYELRLIKETVIQKREVRGKIGTYLTIEQAQIAANAATQTLQYSGMITKPCELKT